MLAGLSLPQLGLSLPAGGLTTLSPCVFPLVLGGSVQGSRLAPLAMGLGMTLSFAAIGVFLGALGPALGIDSSAVRSAGAAMMMAFALVMLVPALSERFSRWMLPMASGANAASARLDGGSLGGALLLGGFERVRSWVLTRVERVRLGFALLLGAMGVAILTGADKQLEAFVLSWLPDAWVNLTVGI